MDGVTEQFNDTPPAGWNEWLAFLQSDDYGKDVDALMDAIRSGRTLDLGLSIECIASCAFAAGMEAAHPSARAAVAGPGEGA